MPEWLTLRRILAIAVPLVIAGFIVGQIVQGGANKPDSNPADAAPWTPDPGTSAVTEPASGRMAEVMPLLEQFVEVYFSIKEGYTTAMVEQAVRASGLRMSEAAVSSMDFTVFPTSKPAQGILDPDLMQVSDISPLQDGTQLSVKAVVVVTQTDIATGETNQESVLLGTGWGMLPDGTWEMTYFGENGDWK